jgi:serine/threonine protein phosphatase PrpC
LDIVDETGSSRSAHSPSGDESARGDEEKRACGDGEAGAEPGDGAVGTGRMSVGRGDDGRPTPPPPVIVTNAQSTPPPPPHQPLGTPQELRHKLEHAKLTHMSPVAALASPWGSPTGRLARRSVTTSPTSGNAGPATAAAATTPTTTTTTPPSPVDTLREAVLVGVFDGHGGSFTVDYIVRKLPSAIASLLILGLGHVQALREAALEVDERVCEAARKEKKEDGSTACFAVISEGVLHLANIGDCRAVLSTGGRARPLTSDHTPSRIDETERVMLAGGEIKRNRVCAKEAKTALAVTRAMGDWPYKANESSPRESQVLIAEPEVKSVVLTKRDEFLIIASDGVWSVMSNQRAVDVVSRALKNGPPRAACEALVKEAYDQSSPDNVTVVVVLTPQLVKREN